jgi:hypothetical protein
VRFARMIIVAAAVPLLLAPVAAEAAGVFDNLVLSPRVRALGGAFVALSDDEMALFTNPAGLADQGEVAVYASYVDLFGYDFLDLGSIAAVVPTTYGTFGVGGRILKAEYQGVDLERELSFSVGHAITLMKNINNPKVGDPDAEDLPQWFTAGVAYSPYGGVQTLLEFQKQDDEDVRACFGVEAGITDYLILRGGLQSDPNRVSVGFGTHWQQIRIDYSYTSHDVLPGTHHFGVGASF